MSLWFNAADADDELGLLPAEVIQPANITKWEQAIRDAIDVQGPRAVSDWKNFRDTGVWSGASLGQAITLYDGVRSFLQAYFYFGCTDSVYLTYAHAVANIQWLWMETNIDGSGSNFYRPATFLFYPDGLTTLFKLDPGFTGGGEDDGLWLTRDANDIPEFFVNVLANSQYGESNSTNDTDLEQLSRETALTVMYYLDSLRVGNTLPATGRFDLLVNSMKIHAKAWIDDGPTFFGIDSIAYMGQYNLDNLPNPEVGDPVLLNLRAWFMNLTMEAMLRTFEEHPSYSTDTELVEAVEKMTDWIILNGRISDYPGTYAGQYYLCLDCDDPIVSAAGSPSTEHCNGNCWHLAFPHSQFPGPAGDKRDDITTPMAFCSYTWLIDNQPTKRKWSDELDNIFNIHAETYDLAANLVFGPGKQFNQGARFIFDVFRTRDDASVYTTFDDGAFPCT